MPNDDDVSTFPIFQEGLFAPFLALPAVARPAEDMSGDEARIRDLLSEYCYRYDSGDVDGVVQLFTPDAVIGNATGTHRGRDAIRENYVDFVAKRRFGFHYVTNITIRVSPTKSEAVGVAYLLTVNVTNAGRSTFVAGTYVGRIVNVSSRSALGRAGMGLYAATKAAVNALTKSWALELARHGVTMNAVGPGVVATALLEKTHPAGSPVRQELERSIPVGHVADPADIAAAVSFFLSREARYVTGQVLYVCGGTSLVTAN